MASRIQGITIEIDGNTTKLQSSLKQLDSSIKGTANQLKDIDRLLKLDPKNTELLTQKQKALKDAIGLTKDRLQQLKDAQSNVSKGTPEWDALQREIIETEQKLKGLQTQYKDFGSVAKQQILAVGDSMQKFGSKVTDVGNKLKPISTFAASIATGIGTLAYKSVSAADDLATLSKQTGISTAELQKMQYASGRVDVSVESITGALTKMKSKMTESNDTFKKLGVSVTNADGSLRSATDVFYDSIAALSQIDNETERDQVAMALFGKSADQLAGIIDDGGASLRQYGKEAEDMGLILTDDTIEALNETNDTIDKVKSTAVASMAKFGATAAQVLAPAVEKVAELLNNWTEKLRNLTPEQTETILKIAGVVAAVAPLLIVGGKLITGIGAVIKVVGLLVGAIGSPVTLAIGAVIAAGVLLYKNWDTIKEKASALKENLTEKWNNIKEKTAETFDNMKEKCSQTWEDIKEKSSSSWEDLKSKASSSWDSVKETVTNKAENIKTGVVNTWDTLKTTLSSSNGTIESLLNTSWETLRTSSSWRWDMIRDSITTAMTSVQTIVSSIWGNISSSFSNTLNNMWSSASSIMNSIYSTISSSLSWISSLFSGIHISFPHISLPHFDVWWQDLGMISIPHISISWYKKAYQNPVMFTSPTVLGTGAGLKGFGDGNGAEIVMGLDKLRELVGAEQPTQDITINIVQQPWQDAKQLAAEVQKVLVRQNNQRVSAYA